MGFFCINNRESHKYNSLIYVHKNHADQIPYIVKSPVIRSTSPCQAEPHEISTRQANTSVINHPTKLDLNIRPTQLRKTSTWWQASFLSGVHTAPFSPASPTPQSRSYASPPNCGPSPLPAPLPSAAAPRNAKQSPNSPHGPTRARRPASSPSPHPTSPETPSSSTTGSTSRNSSASTNSSPP